MSYYAQTTYTSTGGTTYTIPFEYLNQESVIVKVDTITQVNGSDYTINDTTSQVVFSSAPTAGSSVGISRLTPRATDERIVEFEDGGSLTAENLNDSVLQNLFINQELLDELSDLVLDPEVVDLATYDTYEEVRSISALSGSNALIFVRGRTEAGDAGAGFFIWDADLVSSVDDGAILKPSTYTALQAGRWVRLEYRNTGDINILWYGADSSGVSDCSSAINSALATGDSVFIPDGSFRILSDIDISSYQTLSGNGAGSKIIADGGSIRCDGSIRFRINDLAILMATNVTSSPVGLNLVGNVSSSTADFIVENIWIYPEVSRSLTSVGILMANCIVGTFIGINVQQCGYGIKIDADGS
jgi:hypothetical protein